MVDRIHAQSTDAAEVEDMQGIFDRVRAFETDRQPTDAAEAEDIIEKYAKKVEQQYEEPFDIDCSPLNITHGGCNVLMTVFGSGREAEVTSYEREMLSLAGFSKEFIDGLAGDDGRKALKRRAEWFAGRFVESLAQGNFPQLRESTQGLASVDGFVNDRHAVDMLSEMLWESESLEQRLTAVEGLGRVKDPHSVQMLIEKLSETDEPEIQKAAARLLCHMADRNTVPAVIEVLRRTKDPIVFKSLVEVLRELRDRRAVPFLIEELLSDRWRDEDGATIAIFRALGQIGDKRATPYLLKMLAENERSDFLGMARIPCVASLRNLKDPRAASFFIRMLHRDRRGSPINRMEREIAASALGLIGDRKMVPILIKTLWDIGTEYDVEGLRMNIVKSLGKIGDRRAIPVLAEIVRTDDEYLYGVAAEALGSMNSAATTATLKKLFESGEFRIKMAVAKELVKRGDRKAIFFLAGLLGGRIKGRTVFREVAHALVRAKNPQALPAVVKFIEENGPMEFDDYGE